MIKHSNIHGSLGSSLDNAVIDIIFLLLPTHPEDTDKQRVIYLNNILHWYTWILDMCALRYRAI